MAPCKSINLMRAFAACLRVIVAIGLVASCTRNPSTTAPNKSPGEAQNGTLQTAEISITPQQIRADKTFSHGYEPTASSFSLVDRLDLRKRDGLLESTDVTQEELDRWRLDPPSQIYAGRALRLDTCRGDIDIPPDADHVAQLWTQKYLLGVYAGEDNTWFYDAMASLGQADPEGVMRPKTPVHPEWLERLRGGINPLNWSLNAVRFRVADRSSGDADESISAGGGNITFGGQVRTTINNVISGEGAAGVAASAILDVGPPAIEAQIKINYELDLFAAGASRSIESATIIHGVAIAPEYLDEFIVDMLRIRQNPEQSGCDVLAILNKYIRGVGLKATDQPRSGYFFAHTNVLDIYHKVGEWRLAELKPVYGDFARWEKRHLLDALTREAYIDIWMQKLIAEKGPDLDIESIDFEQAATFFTAIRGGGEREIIDPFSVTIHERGEMHRALRIVPMRFARFYALDTDTDRMELATDLQPAAIWFSGNLSDTGLNSSAPGGINLVYDKKTKQPVPQTHPAMRHDEALTCARCHERVTKNSLDPANPTTLEKMSFLNFRHIGYGVGNATVACNSLNGLTRAMFQPYLSEFLLDNAHGTKVNGMVVDESRPTGQAIVSNHQGLDYFRCIAFGQSAAHFPKEPWGEE